MIKYVKVNEVNEKQTPHEATVRGLHDSKHVQVIHVEIAPGKGLRKHITPVDAVFFILEGNATVEIGVERIVVGENTLVDSPAKIPHRVLNESEDILRFLVIKTPRPTEKSQIL